MTAATSITLIDSLLKALADSRQTIEQINAACKAKGLPPALKDSDTSVIGIIGDPDYRFEGFGVIVIQPFPPKFALSFWVHYKPESAGHIELGRFTVPISILDVVKFKSLSQV